MTSSVKMQKLGPELDVPLCVITATFAKINKLAPIGNGDVNEENQNIIFHWSLVQNLTQKPAKSLMIILL